MVDIGPSCDPTDIIFHNQGALTGRLYENE